MLTTRSKGEWLLDTQQLYLRANKLGISIYTFDISPESVLVKIQLLVRTTTVGYCGAVVYL